MTKEDTKRPHVETEYNLNKFESVSNYEYLSMSMIVSYSFQKRDQFVGTLNNIPCIKRRQVKVI